LDGPLLIELDDSEHPHPEKLPRAIVRRLRRDLLLMLLDCAIVVSAYLSTLVIRLEGAVGSDHWRDFWLFLPVALAIHLLANRIFGLYGQMWRYASVLEARRVVLAGLTAGGFIVAVDTLAADALRPIPYSVAVFGAILSLIGFGAVRFQSRLFAFRRRQVVVERTRVLIVGAGDAGAMILKDLLGNPSLGLEPVGIVDDDPRKVGRALYEVPIVGRRADIPAIVARLEVEQVLLAISSATSDLIQDVAGLCEKAGVTLRVLPSVRELVGGRITARDIRDLRIEDLLGRQQVEMDEGSLVEMLKGRRVLITGAGGSIGSEIARQVLVFEPAHLSLLDHDETHLYDLMSELNASANPISGVLADARDRDRVLESFRTERPDVVFHAAAHKHVPLLETHPAEAFRTNILGTANVAEAAVASGVDRFVLISTDKAVRAVSVMGASKWFAEQIVRSLQNGSSILCSVRFGNVLGSRGSVTPTFLRQIASGGPVTVTDPAMTRYFMSVQESVCLVLQAAAMSRGGEVFTLEMGEPVNILELARRLIRLSGRVPGRDIKIELIGSRPGEKLFEDVFDPDEHPESSGHVGIMLSRPRKPDRAALMRALRELGQLVDDADLLADRMKELAAAGFVDDVVRV
jgi:FlaA1/EpsC-like NDP-sugar epimerase